MSKDDVNEDKMSTDKTAGSKQLQKDAAALAEIIRDSDSVVFLGGAGVSTESGVSDFRSEAARDGAFSTYGYTPEELLSRSFFDAKPDVFFDYQMSLVSNEAQPNDAHKTLAKWEDEGRLLGVSTQNIDGFHQAAGSKNVWELHGSIMRFYCMECGKPHSLEDVQTQMADGAATPSCECGGMVRPDVVLYEEALPEEAFTRSAQAIAEADTLIVGGTSLIVYPAAGLLQAFNGTNLVIVNMDPTPADGFATLVIRQPIGKLFAATDQILMEEGELGDQG